MDNILDIINIKPWQIYTNLSHIPFCHMHASTYAIFLCPKTTLALFKRMNDILDMRNSNSNHHKMKQ